MANEDSSNGPDSPTIPDEERGATPASEWKTDADGLTLDDLIRMEESDDPAEQERAREIWQEQMGPAMEKLTSLSSEMVKRVTGPLQEAVATQLRVGDLLKSTGLADAMRPPFDIPKIGVPAFDTSHLDESCCCNPVVYMADVAGRVHLRRALRASGPVTHEPNAPAAPRRPSRTAPAQRGAFFRWSRPDPKALRRSSSSCLSMDP